MIFKVWCCSHKQLFHKCSPSWLYTLMYHTTITKILQKNGFKNLDERPHHCCTCHALHEWVNSDARLSPWCAVPCGQICTPVLWRELLFTQSNAFQWGDKTPKCPFPWGNQTPTDASFLGHTWVFIPKLHVNRVSRFSTAHCRDSVNSNKYKRLPSNKLLLDYSKHFQ